MGWNNLYYQKSTLFCSKSDVVEPPSFCFCYFFEDLALLVQIFCFVKVPFLFLILIKTWVGQLFTVRPGKHNFWNIANHLRVCGEIEFTGCIPKLGAGGLEEIQIPDLQAPPTSWISVSPSLDWARFWCSWALVGRKVPCQLFQNLGDSHSVPAHFWESDMYTSIPCHGFQNLSLSLAEVDDHLTEGKSLPDQNCWDFKGYI